MFQFLKRLHYYRYNNKLEPILEESESDDLEESEFFQYQSFEDINVKPQKNKLKLILKKIRSICLQIRYSIIKVWETFILKKKKE